MFKKFSCGCIAFANKNSNGEACIWCIKSCDADRYDPPYNIFRRDSLSEKESSDLNFEEIQELILSLQELVSDGNSLNNLRSAFFSAGLTKNR